MSSTIDVTLAEIWCSKLCHDLVSPVGAICNGVEFLQEAGGSASDAADLIAQSAGMASDRLKFYRSAYGAAGSQGPMSLDEAGQTSTAYLNWTKSKLILPGEFGSAVFPPGFGKAFLNVLALIESALIYGGDIQLAGDSLSLDGEGQIVGFTLSGEGRKAVLGDDDVQAVTGAMSQEDISPRSVHAYMTGLLVRRLGCQIGVENQGETRISVTVQ